MCIDTHFIKVKKKKLNSIRNFNPKLFTKKNKKKRSQHVQTKSKIIIKEANTLTEKEKKKQRKRRQHPFFFWVCGYLSKGRRQHVKRKNQRKKKKENMLEVKSNVNGIFGSSFDEFLSLSFLLILERIFWWAYFHFSLPNQKHSKKSFPFYFFSKVFHSSYFTSKQTHPYILYLLSRVTPTRLWNQHIM